MPGSAEQGLGFGGEGQALAVLRHVQRLDAEPVAPDQQAAAAGVPQREVEHAVQAMHESVALGLVQMDQDLAVGAGLEARALGLQLGAQLAVVVDLAIADQPDRVVGIAQRLVAAAQVDDRQAAHRDAAGAVDVHAFVVGAAVAREVAHRRQQCRRDRPAVEVDESVDAAHGETRQALAGDKRRRASSAREYTSA